jgi:FtsP/CotA-like multicopper oxidase with cupredoxin domain
MKSRREFIKITGLGTAALMVPWKGTFKQALAVPIPGGTLDPSAVPKYVTQMLIPPVMPKAPSGQGRVAPGIDYYEVGLSQFTQQILPAGLPATTVWGYGPAKAKGRGSNRISNAPSLTIEAVWNRPVRIKWINELVDSKGNFLPHLLPVDPTLHWANPPGGIADRDCRPTFTSTPGRYMGPVPMVTHVHGAVGVGDESDGYAEAWYLPNAANIPAGYADRGTWYDFFAGKAMAKFGAAWGRGWAVSQYPNLGRACTNWYHDHTLGMTRLNVYAGPAGFYIIRGGPQGDAAVLDSRSGTPAILPGPAPKENDKFPAKGTYYEIPIAIQDRAFNSDGSLFYPNAREFFDGISGPYIPPEGAFSPIWQPEFFGNMIMVNGNTWPYQKVERRRYRFRFLNGCQSRFLDLDFSGIPGVQVWIIGNEGGFLAAPFNLTANNGNRLLMGLAERADVIVDFSQVPVGQHVLCNVGPDEPFKGFNPDGSLSDGEGGALDPADPDGTGQVMAFKVVPAKAIDPTTPPQYLALPASPALPAATVIRPLALIEESGLGYDKDGNPVEGPVEALLGNVTGDPNSAPGVFAKKMWMEDITENPALGATEIWEIYNTTADAHPMHVHEVAFEVVNRQPIVVDETNGTVQVEPGSFPAPPEPWETGRKDTVIAYPGQVTRIRMQFNTAGQYVWHCHIVEHEDNEMMRPYRVGLPQPGQPM